jgi:hypothetical protein
MTGSSQGYGGTFRSCEGWCGAVAKWTRAGRMVSLVVLATAPMSGPPRRPIAGLATVGIPGVVAVEGEA